jgi:hypothetical protein
MVLKTENPVAQENEVLTQRKLTEARIAALAWEDETFRKELFADPKAALAKAFGWQIDPAFTISVIEEEANHIHISIPAKPAAGELSEEQLQNVAGGLGGGGHGHHTAS